MNNRRKSPSTILHADTYRYEIYPAVLWLSRLLRNGKPQDPPSWSHERRFSQFFSSALRLFAHSLSLDFDSLLHKLCSVARSSARRDPQPMAEASRVEKVFEQFVFIIAPERVTIAKPRGNFSFPSAAYKFFALNTFNPVNIPIYHPCSKRVSHEKITCFDDQRLLIFIREENRVFRRFFWKEKEEERKRRRRSELRKS